MRSPADAGASAGEGVGSATKILAALARLSPGTDKETLMKTVDSAVDEVLKELQRHRSAGALPPDFLKLVKETLRFLEACSGFRDPTFTRQAKKRAEELQTAFNQMATTAAPAAKAEKPHPPAAAPAPEPQVDATPAQEKFEKAFSDHLCRFIYERLEPFHIAPAAGPPQPYILSARFGGWFEEGLRKCVIPNFVESRRIKLMATNINVDELGWPGFKEMFEKPPKENIVRRLWEDRWSDFQNALSDKRKAAVAEAAKKSQEKKGFLGKFSRKSKAPPPGPLAAVNAEAEASAKEFWKIVKSGAEEGNYDPPKSNELGVFQVLFEFNPEKIREQQMALKQLLRQETSAGEDGREGASRQFMVRAMDALPAYCGEMIALWAFYELKSDFTPNIAKSFLASQGTSAKERRNRLPLFLRWVQDFVSNPPPDF